VELDNGDRLTRLEGSVSSLADSVRTIAGSVSDLGNRYQDISLRLSAIGRWDLKTFVSMIGLAVVPIAALWGLAIAPLEQQYLAEIQARQNTEARVTESAKDIVKQGQKFTEIETQFQEVTQLQIVRHEALEGRVAELWAKEYGTPMSRTTQYHVVGNGDK